MGIDEKSLTKGYSRALFSEQTGIDYWESIYERRDFLGDCYRQRMNQALSWLDATDLSNNSLILDAGCGAGIVTREIAKRGHQVFATDSSRGMLEKVNAICGVEKGLSVQLSQGDIDCLPFRNSVFDIIVCLGVITYLRSEKKALHELSRTLKPGGTLIVSIVNRAHLINYIDIVRVVRTSLKRLLSGRKVSQNYKARQRTGNLPRSYFIPQLRNSLKQQGFRVLEYRTVPLGLMTFLDREIPPSKLNMRITKFIGRLSNIPLVESFGGMCIFRAVKANPCDLE